MAIHSFLIITKILVYSQYFIICLYIIYALPFFFFFLKPNLSIGFTLQFDSSACGCAHSVSLQFHSLPQAQYSYSQNHCLFFIPILKIPRFCFMLSFFFLKIFFQHEVCWMCFAILGGYRGNFFSYPLYFFPLLFWGFAMSD